MKFQFQVTDPQSVEMTMEITMSLKDWEGVREALLSSKPYAHTVFCRNITDMVRVANRTFRPAPEGCDEA
jgi:hypothetical protein